MNDVTVKFGSEVISKNVPFGTTIGQLINDPDLRATLGYGDNTRALINGVEQPNSAVVPNGAIVKVETRANSKAN